MPDQLTPTTLRGFIVRHFNLEEVRTLSVDCDIDYEEPGALRKEALVRELIRKLEGMEKLAKLVGLVKEQRLELFIERFGEIDFQSISNTPLIRDSITDHLYRKRIKEWKDVHHLLQELLVAVVTFSMDNEHNRTSMR